MAKKAEQTSESPDDVLILQSLDVYDRHWPVMKNVGTEEFVSLVEDRIISIPCSDKIGPDGIRQNVIEITRADHEYLLATYKLYKEFVDKGVFKLLESKPLNYLTAAAQIANASVEVDNAKAEADAAKAEVAAKEAEIEALKKKLAGYGETV